MSKTIATISGVMLAAGVSRNRRLYTPEVISKTVKRMQERIADPNGLPITVKTHHGAEDDSSRIVGRITSVNTDKSGTARYTADLYDTTMGRDIANLVTGDKPALRSTSIHGYWLGPVKRVEHDGMSCETADDLEVDSVDMTATPGVDAAVLDISSSDAKETKETRTPISESYTAEVAVPGGSVRESPADNVVPGCDGSCCANCGVNAGAGDDNMEHAPREAKDPKKPYGDVPYADPGYQKDGKKRYALNTKKRVKAAWSYINQKDNQAPYTADQLAKIKGRIKAAAKKFGIEISSDETRLVDRWTETAESVAEFYGDDSARFCVSVSNGPVDVTISSYCIDPADLDVVARAAMDGACQALAGLDPDDDGDIDVPGMVSTTVTASSAGEHARTITVAGQVWDEKALAEEIHRLQRFRAGALTLNEARAELGAAPSQTAPGTTGDTQESNEEGEPTVSEATTDKAAETTGAPNTTGPARAITDEDATAIGQAFAAAMAANNTTAPAQPAPAATETAPTQQATESTTKVDEVTALKEAVVGAVKDAVAALTEHVNTTVGEQGKTLRDELREALVKAGVVPARKGLVRTTESAEGDAAALSPEAAFASRADILLGGYAKTPVPHAATGTAVWPAAAQPAPAVAAQ